MLQFLIISLGVCVCFFVCSFFFLLARFRDQVSKYEIWKFAKLDKKLLDRMDEVLSKDIPNLMKLLPQEDAAKFREHQQAMEVNPFGKGETTHTHTHTNTRIKHHWYLQRHNKLTFAQCCLVIFLCVLLVGFCLYFVSFSLASDPDRSDLHVVVYHKLCKTSL